MRLLPLIAALTVASPALATEIGTPFSGKRPITLDLHAGFAWYGNGAAFGGRFGIPILHNGFVSSINNSVYITFGADAYYADHRDRDGDYVGRGVAVGVPVALQWNFYFADEWSAFGEAGFNLYVHDGDFRPGYYWGIAAIGGRYHFNENLALHLRLGSPYSSLGLEISF